MTKFFSVLLTIALCLVTSAAFAAPFINVVDDMGNGWIDIFYNPDPNDGLEFNAWDLVVIPEVGGLLDPDTAAREDDVSDGAAADTWGNTVFSSFGAGAASHIFTSYNPGSAFPPVAPDPLPTAGGAPDRLEWTMFDTASGDGFIQGFTPYHMGRVMYEGQGTWEVKFFENGQFPDVPTIASGPYGIPEPGSLALAGLGLIGVFASRRRRS